MSLSLMPASPHDRRTRRRVAALALVGGFGIIGLSACGSTDASGTTPAPPVAPAPTQPATTVVATTVPATEAPTTLAPVTTDAATTPVAGTETVTEADVADMEKQLDDIDQLLSGVDADLAQD